MADFEIPKPGPIKVIKEPKFYKVKIKLPANTAPHPPGYKFFWMLADVYVVHEDKEEGYFIPEAQAASFGEGNPLIMLVDVPKYIYTHPGLDPNKLRLLYYDKYAKKWEMFVNSPPNLETYTIEISFTDWIIDPPLGWGGNEPT